MPTTTKDEMPEAPLPKVESSEESIKKEAIRRYERGENLYTITRAIYRFESEEAVESIRRVLSTAGYLDPTHQPPATQIVED